MRFKLYEDNRVKSSRSFFPNNTEVNNTEANVPEEVKPATKKPDKNLYVNYCWYSSDNANGIAGESNYTFKYNPKGAWQILNKKDSVFATSSGKTKLFYINIYSNPKADLIVFPRIDIYIDFNANSNIHISSAYLAAADITVRLEDLHQNPVPAFTADTAASDRYVVEQMITYLVNWIYDERPDYVEKLLEGVVEDTIEEIDDGTWIRGHISINTEPYYYDHIECNLVYRKARDAWEPIHEEILYNASTEEEYREDKLAPIYLPFQKRHKDYNDVLDLNFEFFNPTTKKGFQFITKYRDFNTNSFSYVAVLDDFFSDWKITVDNENVESIAPGKYYIDFENFVDDFAYIVTEFWQDAEFHDKMLKCIKGE